MTSPTRGEKLFRLKADELQEQLRGWSSLQFWWVEAANGGGPNYLRNYMTHIADNPDIARPTFIENLATDFILKPDKLDKVAGPGNHLAEQDLLSQAVESGLDADLIQKLQLGVGYSYRPLPTTEDLNQYAQAQWQQECREWVTDWQKLNSTNPKEANEELEKWATESFKEMASDPLVKKDWDNAWEQFPSTFQIYDKAIKNAADKAARIKLAAEAAAAQDERAVKSAIRRIAEMRSPGVSGAAQELDPTSSPTPFSTADDTSRRCAQQ